MNFNHRIILLFFILMLSHVILHADGSKDFYPRGVFGNRAYLQSASKSTRIHPFINEGKHFVYAKVGETIAMASSVQGFQGGRIILTSPNGERFVSGDDSIGQISENNNFSSRGAELAGPRVGYIPFEVLSNVEGVWTVDFLSLNEFGFKNSAPPNVYANEDWIQPLDDNLIAAWDISVRNISDTEWIKGRVYANVLNFYIPSSMNDNSRSFYGQNYVLTKDGYIYKVDGNGSIGLRFTYFVNNTGFLDYNGKPTYKSSNDGYNARVHYPEDPDVGDEYVTHKLFYTFPDLLMPKQSKFSLTDTWLINNIEIAKVSNIKLIPSEGTKNNVNIKNNYIFFTTNYAGRYKVSITEKDQNFKFKKREIIFNANIGENRVAWDGKDGDGILLPVGKDYPISIEIGSINGEIHFPYFDMEVNPNGILVERVDRNGDLAGAAIVYWDDSEITRGISSEESNPITNLDGIPSNLNGHSWGSYSWTMGDQNFNYGTGAASFGNNKAMDTWSYSVQVNELVDENITVEITDLEIINVTANIDTIELGESVSYEIELRNSGPSDAVNSYFSYDLPKGFDIQSIQSSGNCGSLSHKNGTGNSFSTQVSLESGCSIKISITARTFSSVPDDTYGVVSAISAIVRSKGVYDPDATSVDFDKNVVGSAQEECISNCNNVKVNDEVFLLEPYNERGQITLIKKVLHLDSNQTGFQEEGEELEYSFIIKNIGFVTLKDVYITDPLLSKEPFLGANILEVGEEVVLTKRYIITSNDVKKRSVTNTASVLAKNPRKFDVKDVSGTDADNNLPTQIDIDQKPKIFLKKTITNFGTGEKKQFTLGDSINYRFEIKSEGYLAISNLLLIDSKLFPNPQNLNSGIDSSQNLILNYSYIITEEDIDNKEVVNSATIIGKDTKYNLDITDISGTDFDNNIPTIVKTAIKTVTINDKIETYQGNSIVLNVIENDSIGSSAIDNIEILNSPRFGDVKVVGNKIIYMHKDKFTHGIDEFTYRIKDNSRLLSNIASVVIEIKKTVPIAVPDNYSVELNYQIQMRPYQNDYVDYSKINPNSIKIISNPQFGQLSSKGDGVYHYKPDKNFTGFDEFSYMIQDENNNWSEEAKVTIETKGLVIPNIITPNGDGINDKLEILGIYYFDNVELDVFDRFGRSVFKSSNYKNDWDVDSKVSEGTYYYIIRGIKEGKEITVRKGNILILKNYISRN